MAKKFKQYATNIDIIIKNAPVKAYHSISIVEYYHGLLWQIYFIITLKVPYVKADLALQVSFKVINISVSLN